MTAQVLVPAADGSAYEFRHALLREAAYAEVLPGEREALHALLARELEAEPELAGAPATLAGELAHHWQAAGELERALPASIEAGRDAERVFAHPEALRHYQRALELTERVGPAARDAVDRVELTTSAARSANAAGDHRLAVALAERVVELVDERAEPLLAGVSRAPPGRVPAGGRAGRGGPAPIRPRRRADPVRTADARARPRAGGARAAAAAQRTCGRRRAPRSRRPSSRRARSGSQTSRRPR